MRWMRRCACCGQNYGSEAPGGRETYCPACCGGGEGVQLQLAEEVVAKFRLPLEWHRREGHRLPLGYVTVLRDDYRPGDGKVPGYRPVHWHDWMKQAAKPWRPPPRGPMKTRPGPNTYTIEET